EGALAVEPGGQVIRETHALERRGQRELRRMQDERATVTDLDELGEVLLGLLRVDERRRVVPEHAEVPVDVHVDGRRLDVGVVERLDGDATRLQLGANGRVRQDHVTLLVAVASSGFADGRQSRRRRGAYRRALGVFGSSPPDGTVRSPVGTPLRALASPGRE